MAKEKTLKELFSEVREVVEAAGREDLVAFVDGRVALLNKKSSSKSKASEAKAAENAELEETILGALSEVGAMTVSEIAETLNHEYTPQKLTSRITAMVNDGRVIREKIKGGKVIFTAA